MHFNIVFTGIGRRPYTKMTIRITIDYAQTFDAAVYADIFVFNAYNPVDIRIRVFEYIG